MIKTIEVDGKKIKLNGSMSWVYIFKGQTGEDPLDIIMPLIKAAIPMIVEAQTKGVNLDNLTAPDYDQLTDILAEIKLEDALNLIWALAKAGNADIEEPQRWYAQFENLPMDEILLSAGQVIIQSVLPTKKYKALSDLMDRALKRVQKVSSAEAFREA